MVCELVKDPRLLSAKSEKATAEDVSVATDLIDTLQAHLDEYPGLAACMIGEHKRILAIAKGSMVIAVFNPSILMQSGGYEAMEKCPLLGREQSVKRYKTIRLLWYDAKMKEHVALLDGYQAEVVQHLIDHCDGILI